MSKHTHTEPHTERQDYSALDPDLVLDALADAGLHGDGRMLALNSYENRVYQIGLEDADPVVVKFYRPLRWSDAQILEEHAFVLDLYAAEIPVVAPLAFDGRTLLNFDGYRFAVFPRRGGRAPELDDPETLEWMGRFLGRIHAMGRTAAYRHRPRLSLDTFGIDSLTYLVEHDVVPLDMRESYISVLRQALDTVAAIEAQVGPVGHLRLHGDCHAGNVLWTDRGPHFVDFDDSRSGPAIQDIWMLLSGEPQDMRRQLTDILVGYEDFCDFDARELGLIESLRTLRLIHYSTWIAKRWADPAFPAAFPWFASPRYWQDRVLELREQIALMNDPPLRGY